VKKDEKWPFLARLGSSEGGPFVVVVRHTKRILHSAWPFYVSLAGKGSNKTMMAGFGGTKGKMQRI